MFRFALYVLLAFKLCELVTGLAMLGKVDLFFQRMEQCEPELRILDVWVTLRKFNRTVDVMDITWSSSYPVDDSIQAYGYDSQLELKGSLKKEGGYKPGAFYFKEKACTALEKMLGDMFTDVLQSAGLESCPLPAGSYSSPGFYFDNEKFEVPQIYGEYMMEIFVYKDELLQSCFKAFYEMRAKS